jgi:methylenetetrahydrofolate reductase (NADPH)
MPASRLEALVRSRRFVVTSEVVPPRAGSLEAVERQARELVGYTDAVNLTDNPTASVHMSSVAGAAAVARAGLEPTLQLTVRDRNRLALAADLLGAWALGARNLLALTGDPLTVGDHPDASAADDVDVTGLIGIARSLREQGRLPNGTEIAEPPRFYVGVADTPLVDRYDPARLEAKLDAGAAFVMTQIAYDVEAISSWLDRLRERGVLERAVVIVGVAPLRSAAQARYMNEHLPGVAVPQELTAALEAAGPDAEPLGAAQCVEIVTRLRTITGVSGVHVMGMGREEVVRHVIEGAGLLPRPSVEPT